MTRLIDWKKTTPRKILLEDKMYRYVIFLKINSKNLWWHDIFPTKRDALRNVRIS